MDSEIWRNLPQELLERTLSFLSTPALFRLRTVCRRWNNLICDPGFLHRATQEYVVARWTIKGSVLDLLAYKDGYIDYEDNQGYSILDVHLKRWYTIPCIDSPAYYMIPSDNVAVDGGLVCYVLDATEHWLWRYDARTPWSDTGVAILGCVLADPKLMAGGDSRMLLAAWQQSSSGEFIYEVSEVHYS